MKRSVSNKNVARKKSGGGKSGRNKQPVRLESRQLRWLIAGLGALVVTVGVLLFCLQGYGGREREWIEITAASTHGSVRDSLKARLGSAMGNKAYVLWRLQGGGLHVGAYAIEPGESAFRIGRSLATGRQTPVRLTFNNVRTMEQLADVISDQMMFSSQDFLGAVDSVLTPQGFSHEEWAACFLPDTYEVYRTWGARRVVDKLIQARNAFWTADRVMKAQELGLTAVGVATIASIAEEETGKADERGKVGRLYVNRLQRGMKLQADPTVKFAVGDFSIRRIQGAMLRSPSPYNTYLHGGLPPGPIRIASASTIDAVLESHPHPYIYMCAKADFSGYHDFARDYAAHQSNARRYQAALDARGIK